ncbi:MAG: DUF262 domain-containing protein [Candidatus Hadarchaeales archaeon]
MPEEKIPSLVSRLRAGDITIPEFQREFVWTDLQIEMLADSIYRGYPIGNLILFIPSPELGKGQWVVDGQQRLLSLQLITTGEAKLKRGQKRGTTWFNPKSEKFHYTESLQDLRPEWVKVSELFGILDRLELEKYLSSQNWTPEEKERIAALWGNLREYNIPYYTVDAKQKPETLAEIFVRTNYAGTKVRGTDISYAILAVASPGSTEELKNFIEGLPAEWREIDYSVAVKIFLALMTDGKIKLASTIREHARKLKDLLETKKAQISDITQKTKDLISRSIKLLEDGWLAIKTPDPRWIPYENSLVTLGFYLARNPAPPKQEESNLLMWHVLASFFGRYSASSDTRLNEDLSVIAQGGKSKDLIKNLGDLEVLKSTIKDNISNGCYSPLLIYAILRKNEAGDLLTGNPLSSEDVSIHHIFPSSLVRDNVDDVGNITLTTHGTNSHLRAKKPEEYLPRVAAQIRDRHLIPQDPNLWQLSKFKEFVETRKKMIKETIDKFFTL